jgi:hypothetical protein
VLTHEHVGYVAHNRLGKRFSRAYDFVDNVVGSTPSVFDSRDMTLARALLRGQGYLMVSVSQFIIQKLALRYDRSSRQYSVSLSEDANSHSVRQLIQAFPFLVRYMRLYELIVKVGDDIGDLSLDIQRDALNVFTSGGEVCDDFINISDLPHTPLADGHSRMLLLKIMDEIHESMVMQNLDWARTAGDLSELLVEGVDQLGPLEDEVTTAMLAGFRYDIDNPERAQLARSLASLIGIMYEVVYGSIVNARYNDQFTEDMGAFYSRPYGSAAVKSPVEMEFAIKENGNGKLHHN